MFRIKPLGDDFVEPLIIRAWLDQALADEKSGTRTGTTDVRHPRKRRT
ncbi:hypothetical protein [Streptomyces sp. NPDC001985]